MHFPIGLVPISWVALITARRRSDAPELIRSFLMFGGIATAGAAAFAWLDAGFRLTDGDRILLTHRWTGTALGVMGFTLAMWAWRRHMNF